MNSRYALARRTERPEHEVFEEALQKYEDDFQQRWGPFDDGSRPGPALQLLPYRLARRIVPGLKPPSYQPFLVDLFLQLLVYVPPMALLGWAAAALDVAMPAARHAWLGGVVMGAGIAVMNRLYDIFVPLPSWRDYLERAAR